MSKNRDGLENSNDWATPKWLYKELDSVFHFDFDPCPLNATFDGLSDDCEWGSSNFINPPYDRINKPKFIARAIREWVLNMSINVILVPSATGPRQFHKELLPYCDLKDTYSLDNLYAIKQKGILFFEGRLAFEGYNTKGVWTDKNKGKHDSMLIVLK